ncbi:MAG: transposase [Rhodobacteraceae bacterium]|nr:transposase [Paracoccaceae bacterium]
MARPLRALVPGVPVHIIQRGHNRSQVFFGAEDAQRYLGWLKEMAALHGVAVHAYVLMTNHLHLLATPKAADSLPKAMQRVGTRYAMYLNDTRDRTGSLWEGRYRACPVESERYLLACSRYIELNPVRAKIARDPREFRWSSYRHNIGERSDALITAHATYRALGFDATSRAHAYHALFETALPDATIEAIRAATNAGRPLGDDKFVAAMGRALDRSFVVRKRGRPPKTKLVPGKLQKANKS